MGRPGRFGRWPCGFLGTIGLVLLVEGFVARHDLEFSSLLAEDWRFTTLAARRLAPGNEVLCFGDSLVKYAVLPPVIEARSGRRAYNLALCSGGVSASYFLLRRSLEGGARPAAVLVDFNPLLLGEAPKVGVRAWSVLTSWRDALDLAWSYRDPEMFALFAIAKALPSARDRFEVRANALAALRGASTSIRPYARGYWRHWGVNRGGQPMPVGPFRDDNLATTRAVCPDSWRCPPVLASYARRFLDLAASRRITVFLVIPPMIADVEARRESSGVGDAYARYVRGLLASYPNLVVIDGRGANYGPDVYCDPVHLHRRGASILSSDLADILARDLASWRGGPRWVRLPPFRDRPVGVPIEDLNESAVAVLRNDAGGLRR